MSATFSMRDAATLLLVRDTQAGLEVFMVERPGAADFGGMHVFPGGKVDAVDSTVESRCVGLNDSQASERLGMTRGGIAFWSAAIREAFEEVGVLLGYRGDRLVDLSDHATRDRFADRPRSIWPPTAREFPAPLSAVRAKPFPDRRRHLSPIA